ncbi:Predicted O-methyltransferase YrrM [Olivibacter domesticus]|uniref:Predicted O-methyltransferase YrrM n=2 Tax=Olivibacter domesticus TaxID=407022 RepID=A0A1H7TJ10_OLID1|nr:Predicted O-methyltransferase YrrM [Olivibacter domesticus]
MFVAMDILDSQLSDYLSSTCDKEPSLLENIDRDTHLKETMPHMLSGHYQGRLLSMISHLISPQKILEIGTFTGYATICLAEGLTEQGVLHTIDINEELEERVQAYFNASGFGHKIKYHVGEATNIIPSLSETFDLVFIDADKKNNLRYYELVIDKVRSGGLILIDNVLWKGKIVSEHPDKQTEQILALNDFIAQDKRVQKLILPVRDGIFLIRKR